MSWAKEGGVAAEYIAAHERRAPGCGGGGLIIEHKMKGYLTVLKDCRGCPACEKAKSKAAAREVVVNRAAAAAHRLSESLPYYSRW